MPRNATAGRLPIKTNLINGLFFDGTAGVGTATAPADVKIATKTVRVILRPTRLYSSTVGIFGLNTANWYLAFAGSAYRYSYFDASGVQKVGGSTAGTVVANVPQEVVMVHSNDGVAGGEVYLDFYIKGVFINRVTNTNGDGGGAWGTALTVGAAVGVRSASSIYLAEIYASALTAQDVADLWINKPIATMPIHQYIPNASASTLSDTGSGTTTDLALSSTFLTNDAPFMERTAQVGRIAESGRIPVT